MPTTHTARCTIAHCKQCPAEQSARGCLQNGVRLGRFARIFYNAWKSTSVSPLLSQSRTLKPQLIQTTRCSKKGVIWRSRNSWSHVAPVPIHRGRVNAAARYVLLIAPLFSCLFFHPTILVRLYQGERGASSRCRDVPVRARSGSHRCCRRRCEPVCGRRPRDGLVPMALVRTTGAYIRL